MKQSLLGFLTILFLTSPAAGQQRFEPNVDSRREAIAKGQVKEFQAAMEALGLEAEKNQRWAEASSAYSEASYTAKIRGEMQKAIFHATKAIELAQRANDASLESFAMSWLALAYRDVGQLEKEREWLKKAVEVTKKIQGSREIYEARLNILLGQSNLRQRETKEAIDYFSYSVQVLDPRLSYLKRVGASRGQVQAQAQMFNGLRGLGTAHLQAGNPLEGIKAFERGLGVSETARLPQGAGQVQVYLGLGQAYLAQRDFTRAMENLNKGLQMAEGRQLTSLTQEANSGIGDVFLRTDRPLEALPHYSKAIDSIESTRSLLESEELRTSFFEDKGQVYGGVILAHLGAKNVEEAFNYNERARSRAFLDILGSKVRLGRQGALMEEERVLLAKFSELRAKLAGQGGAGGGEGDTGARQLTQELDAVQKEYTDFLSKLRKENKEQASLMNVEPLTLKQVQELLDPGISVIEYFVVRGKAVLWVIDKNQAQVVRLDLNREEIISKVTAFRKAITELAEKQKLDVLSKELYKLLVQPALAHVKGNELIIIPHDVLHYLPFQALLSPQGRYLIEDYPIDYLSSASLMQFTQEKRKAKGELSSVLSKSGKVLALGNPDLNDPKMSLQFAGIEAKEIKYLYPQSSIYLEKEATEERAKSLSPQNDIVHFASHAELSDNDPLSSAVLLAKSDKEDGRLEVREVFSMDLKASLLVLSACETGLGKLSSGDELVGLTRAFIYAGTPSVVASLWNVEDSSTAQLMASFYKNLKTMTKVEALRQAQLNLIRGNVNSDLLARRGIGSVGRLGESPAAKPSADSISNAPLASVSTSHPYFWAPFILVGEGK